MMMIMMMMMPDLSDRAGDKLLTLRTYWQQNSVVATWIGSGCFYTPLYTCITAKLIGADLHWWNGLLLSSMSKYVGWRWHNFFIPNPRQLFSSHDVGKRWEIFVVV